MNPSGATTGNSVQSAAGWRVRLFGKGRSPALSKNANDLVRPINALGNLKWYEDEGATNAYWLYTDNSVALVTPPFSADRSAATDISVKRAQITAINDDYLVCDQWDNVGEDFGAGSVNIAKPPHLRSTVTARTIWGVSITYGSYTTAAQQRTATYNSVAVIQRVHDPYIIGDEIWFADTGEQTGVSTYTRIDLNIAGRDWFTETEGCDDAGDPQYSFVARGPWSATAIGSEFA